MHGRPKVLNDMEIYDWFRIDKLIVSNARWIVVASLCEIQKTRMRARKKKCNIYRAEGNERAHNNENGNL